MNRHPINSTPEQRWGFVTNTNDGDSYRFIWATFNTAGNYSVIVDARSNFFFMDKMVLRRVDVSDTDAFNLENNESTCFDGSLSVNNEAFKNVKMFPNPTSGKVELKSIPVNTTLLITDVLGNHIKKIKTKNINEIIDLSTFKNGVYFIISENREQRFVKKVIKY